MSECTHDCSSCTNSDCASRNEIQKEALNEFSRVGKVIGVVSGKGGVGKSLVTSMLASAVAARGKKAAVLDADITGPSIPKIFGITEKAMGDGMDHLLPATSRGGRSLWQWRCAGNRSPRRARSRERSRCASAL